MNRINRRTFYLLWTGLAGVLLTFAGLTHLFARLAWNYLLRPSEWADCRDTSYNATMRHLLGMPEPQNNCGSLAYQHWYAYHPQGLEDIVGTHFLGLIAAMLVSLGIGVILQYFIDDEVLIWVPAATRSRATTHRCSRRDARRVAIRSSNGQPQSRWNQE